MKLEISKKHKHYTALDFPLLTWEEVIDHIDKNVIAEYTTEAQQNYGVVTYNAYEMEKTLPILELVKQTDTSREYTAYMHLSFSSKTEGYGRHKDQADVWHWQTIGKSRWVVFDRETVVYDLTPGELIYIPKGMYHQVTPLTPRVGISYGLEAQNRIPHHEWLKETQAWKEDEGFENYLKN